MQALTEEGRDCLLGIFLENKEKLVEQLISGAHHEKKVLILTEPLCDLQTRERIFKDIIAEYGKRRAGDFKTPIPGTYWIMRSSFPIMWFFLENFPWK